ncbi:protein-serine O-palmitoleoyltransferase porcupine-like [Ptychodera flava]|uniref:protein-serine O-palmitoleoyltransferase porcupine-like n=1 Tax=Ptychodera flava TaxID=63121 RepID=UPI00396A93F4
MAYEHDYAYDYAEYEALPQDMLEDYLYGNPAMLYNQHDYMYDHMDHEYTADISYTDLMFDCIIPTLQQGVQIVTPLLLLCVGFRFFAYAGFPSNALHFFSCFSGLCCVFLFFEMNLIYLLYLGVIGYIILWMLQYYTSIRYKGAIVAAVLVVLLILCELFLVSGKEWHKIRGSQMMLAMRIISLSLDVDQGTLPELPNPMQYFGYCYFLGGVIFGPWVSFQQYCQIEDPKNMDLSWLWKVLKSFVKSLMCLVISVCIAPTLTGVYALNRWTNAYQAALSFRFSHYFISFMSEATTAISGIGFTEFENHYQWDLRVAKPWHVEFPRSLVEVVTYWNIPMHNFLKNYIFNTAKVLGAFPAVIITYAVSAILHGLNFQLAAVLLSLGLFTYTEHVLRRRLSQIFNACILAKRCPTGCSHQYKETDVIVFLANMTFGLCAVFHLAYLGVMFDSNAQLQEEGYAADHTLSKWAELDYASHYVVLVCYVFYKLI